MQPFFTIILPTYNRASFISKAIQSVIDQEYGNWELIIVDDGSTDNTKEVVLSYRDERIKYYWQENAGRSAARNNGVDVASGEYICFLDSDDYYTKDHLHYLHQVIEQNGQPIAAFYTMIMELIDNRLLKVPVPHYKFENRVDEMLVNIIMTSRISGHHSVFEKERFDPKLSVGEDRELLVRIACNYPIIEVPEWTVVYIEHGDRTVNQNQEANLVHNISLVNDIVESHRGHLSKVASRLAKAITWYNLAKHYLFDRRTIKMIKCLAVSSYYSLSFHWKSKIYMILRPQKSRVWLTS